MRVLYIYSGTRKDKFTGTMGVDFPDTQFYGLNHLSKFGIEAEYKEPDAVLPAWFLSLPFGFRLAHFLLFFVARKYDLVFGSSIIYMLIWKKILPSRAKFVLLNFNIIRTLTANHNRPLRKWIYTSLLRELDGVVCLSRHHKERVEQELPFLRGKVYFCALGVDADFYTPAFESRDDYILSVGKDNGRDYNTVAKVANKVPKRQFRFICLPRNLVGVDVPENVTVLSNVPLLELRKNFMHAQALIMALHQDAQAHREGSDYPGQTVLLEAMAVGLPIVVSRQQYLADYLEDGKDALLVDFYDSDGIARALEKLSDVSLRKTLAQNARIRAEREFTTENLAKCLAEIFKQVVV